MLQEKQQEGEEEDIQREGEVEGRGCYGNMSRRGRRNILWKQEQEWEEEHVTGVQAAGEKMYWEQEQERLEEHALLKGAGEGGGWEQEKEGEEEYLTGVASYWQEQEEEGK